MALGAIPEQGLHVASCFVHALFLTASIYHTAFSLRNPVRVPILRFDPHKHTVLSFRSGIAMVLTAVAFGEFVYQLDNKIYPDSTTTASPIYYADQILTILAWASNTCLTILMARNGAWLYFKVIDHFLMVISWTFVEAIEALRFHLYVVLHGKASSEQLTSTIVLALGAMYFVTLVAFLLVDVCRKSGRCVVKYEQLDHDEQDAVTFSRDPMAPATSSVISVAVPDGPSQQIVVVHCEDEGRVDC